jgi:hypothetical protein
MWTRSIPGRFEVVLATGLFALFAGAARPTQSSGNISANEVAAIATLRAIYAAENELRARCAIDTDGDGIGEYGYFAELAGTKPVRICVNGGAHAGRRENVLPNPLLAMHPLGDVRWSAVESSGYLFELFLPDECVGGQVAGIREDLNGGKLSAPYPAAREGARYWCCYAWPMHWGHSGMRAFVVNQTGEILQDLNRNSIPYDDHVKWPQFDEAYTHLGDMTSPLRFGPEAGGHDNTVWYPVDS